MYKKVHSEVFPSLRKAVVWKVWTDIESWPKWHDDLDFCKMEGPFVKGGHFLLKPKGMNPVKIDLIEVVPNSHFTDCTSFFGAKMTDTHRMEETPEGLRLTNTLTVEGPLSWLWILLVARHVASTVPDEMKALVELTRREHG